MKARIENNTIRIYSTLPQDFENILNFRNADEMKIKSKGFYDVVSPAWDSSTQILGEIYFDEVQEVFTYPVNNKAPEQIKSERIARINAEADMVFNRLDPQLVKKLLSDRLAVLPEEATVEFRTFYPPFRVGIFVETGTKIYYPANDKLYEVITGHRTQADWTPDLVPALFKEVPALGVIPQWVQPTGAHDAYNIPDKVMYNGFTWECKANANTWMPGVYGWSLI